MNGELENRFMLQSTQLIGKEKQPPCYETSLLFMITVRVDGHKQ